MKKLIYYSPYIPIVGIFTTLLLAKADIETVISEPNGFHFALSAFWQALVIISPLLYFLFIVE